MIYIYINKNIYLYYQNKKRKLTEKKNKYHICTGSAILSLIDFVKYNKCYNSI